MAEIGYRLVRAREARGLTLEDAERDTRISRRYLEALEDEQFELIPAPVYARGFLRSYAQYLGMDPQDILALFPRADEPRSANGTAAQPPQASMQTPIAATSASRPTWRKPPRFDSGRPARQPEPRRRREPPPMRGSEPNPAASAKAADFVIGEEPAAAPATPPRNRKPTTPQLSPPSTPAQRRPPSRTVVTDPVIGQDPASAPARRLHGAGGDNQRNLIVVVSAIGIIAVVAIAAFLIASLGGDDGDGQDPGSTSVSGTAESTGTSGASATGTTPTTPGGTAGVVPDVIGESESVATELIEDAGLKVRVLTEPNAQPEGTVTDQSPTSGTALTPGAEVTIVVSEGQ